MASVRKRTWTGPDGEPKSAWAVDYRDAAGKRHQKTFARKKDADAWLVRAQAEVAAGTHLAERGSRTIAAASERWLRSAAARGLEPLTIGTYDQHVRLHIVPRIGAVKLARVTDELVADCRDDLLRALSRPLAAKVMTSLRSILRDAGRPTAVRIEPQRRHQERVAVPSSVEVAALIEGAAQPARSIFALAALAGLRASEIMGLRWADVDLPRAEVHVRQRSDARGGVGAPKSAEARRTVPIGRRLVGILADWQGQRAAPDGLVFPSRAGTPQTLSNLRKRVIGGERLHRLRHFYATWSVTEGVPLAIVSRHMGHSSIVITADTYGHLLPPDAGARDRLDATEAKIFERRAT